MIDFIHGALRTKQPTRVVVEAGGVGYEILIPLTTYDRLPAEGADVRVLTHHLVREDGHFLFGFASEEHRALFRLLLTVSGVGPKVALSVLSGLSAREFKAALAQSDVKRLSSISGVGKKTAERLVVELRDKIPAGEALEAVASETEDLDSRTRDAVMALISLGYPQANALKMVRGALRGLPAEATVEDLVRKSLSGGA